MVLNSMANHSEHANENPTLDSDINVKLGIKYENRSGNDRRKDFDRKNKVGRRRSNDRRRRKEP
jgi:hypothetical protein